MINIQDIRLTAQIISRRIGVHERTVNRWCKTGKLEYFTCNNLGRAYVITGEAFAEFLYHNPKYARVYRGFAGGPNQMEEKEAIFAYLDTKPRVYSSVEIAYLLGCSEQTVRNLVEAEVLVPTEQSCYRSWLFQKEAVDQALQDCPRLRKLYTASNEERAADTL